MVGSPSAALYELAPTPDEGTAEDGAAGLGRLPAARGSCARGLAVAAAAALGAGCLYASLAKQSRNGMFNQAADPTAYVAVSVGGTHNIVSRSNGKCLHWAGAVVGLARCGATGQQMWTYAGGRLEAPDGQCLDMAGKEVYVSKCKMTAGDAVDNRQHWKFDEETGEIRHHAKENVCLAVSSAGPNVAMEACDKDNQGQRWHVDVRALLASAIEELDNEPTKMQVFEEEKSQRAAGERPSPAAAPNRAPDSKAWQQAVPDSEEANGGAPMPIPVPWLLVLFGSVLLLVAAVCALLLACEGQEAETPQSPRVMILEVDEEEGAGAAPGAGPAAKAAKAEPLAEEAGAAAAEPAAEDVEAAAPPQQPQEEQAAPMTGRKEPEQPAPAAPRSRVPAPEKKKGTKCTVM